ncbi:MAG: alpha/beta hydrolase [Idiomarinaceae bacterium]|nr:alpha/beta hydrolase [Idiomarinaceae bacterium]|tara:strand:+ start:74 stop:907 length:834 start_codon:yes stop_codon:yes gene_type:complete
MKKLSAILISVSVFSALAQEPRSNVSFSDVLAVPFANPDQRIHYGDSPLQFAEHWQVDKRQSSAPIILSIHGGCWLNAYAIEHTYAMNTALRDAGFEVWSLEYRRVGDDGGGWPGSFTDIQNGLVTIAAQYGGEQALAQRDVTLIGHSAGGHLALLAGQQATELVDRIVGLAAITDIKAYAAGENSCQQAGKRFMEGADDQAWKAANPAEQAAHPATYLFHGDADSIVPLTQSREFATREQVEVVWLEGAGHFDVIDPQSRAWLTILNKLKQLSAQD